MIFCAHQTLYDNIDISEWKFLHAKYSCYFSGYVGPKKFHKQHILPKDVCVLRVKSCTSQLHMKVILTIIEMSIMKRNNFFVIKLPSAWQPLHFFGAFCSGHCCAIVVPSNFWAFAFWALGPLECLAFLDQALGPIGCLADWPFGNQPLGDWPIVHLDDWPFGRLAVWPIGHLAIARLTDQSLG